MRSLFERVRDHLLAQNERSKNYSDDGLYVCAYRGERGLKCAVGVLIPDEAYDPSMEGFGVYQDVFTARYNDEELNLLTKLQAIHDYYEPAEWPAFLDELEEEIFGKV